MMAMDETQVTGEHSIYGVTAGQRVLLRLDTDL